MSDIGVAEIPVDEDERPLPPPAAPVKNALLDGPILRTLLWLAWPNVIALTAGTCVVIAETSYIGRLGVESLAAMALVFPTVILTMTMSGGAMGGGVASAIARALGAGDIERASTLAAHALLIGLCFGLAFMLGMLIFGPALLELLGGRGNVLAQAVAYTQIFFGGAVMPWLMNTMAGILRGTGNMKLPSLMMLSSAVCQIIHGRRRGAPPAPPARRAARARSPVDLRAHGRPALDADPGGLQHVGGRDGVGRLDRWRALAAYRSGERRVVGVPGAVHQGDRSRAVLGEDPVQVRVLLHAPRLCPRGRAPVTPFAPVAPLAPVGPLAPAGPCAPVAPLDPVAPFEPVVPFAPWTPVVPLEPFSRPRPWSRSRPCCPLHPEDRPGRSGPVVPGDRSRRDRLSPRLCPGSPGARWARQARSRPRGRAGQRDRQARAGRPVPAEAWGGAFEAWSSR